MVQIKRISSVSSSNQARLPAGNVVPKQTSDRLSSGLRRGLSVSGLSVNSQDASREVSNQQEASELDVSTLIRTKLNQFERRLQDDMDGFADYQDIWNRFNELKQKAPFYSSDADKLNLLWNSFGSNDVLFSKDELSKLPKNPIRLLFKEIVSKISGKTGAPQQLEKPIGYAYDPKATLGKQSSGLVSYELVEQDPHQDIDGKKLSDKLPAGKSIRIPKGFEITKICGGGSGSINMLIHNKKTNQRFFMKYFHSSDAKLEGHSWKQQFNETVAILHQQVGNIPLLEKDDLVVNIKEAEDLSSEYRMQVFQLGVVVGSSQFAAG